ncbi:hypothetical protein CW702_02745 [Candidatus Bathyarchaeota archaeon]|nr:MAG: hypothetical protein CW702_02745 [Candidatus Bathyarchaeota archaeon]
MGEPMLDSYIKVLDVEPYFKADKLRVPLKFGKVVMTEVLSFIVKVTVENRRGDVDTGFGAMPLAEKWAFPEPRIPSEKKLKSMRLIAEKTCRLVKDKAGKRYQHPLDIMLSLRDDILRLAKEADKEAGLPIPTPVLGVLVATSPIDAALHDAFGKVNGISSYEGYSPQYIDHDLSVYLGEDFKGLYISDFIRSEKRSELPVFHLVGALDKLWKDEVDESDPRDGLPVSLDEWIRRDGVYCLKVKLSGVDVDWDVKRTKEVAEVAHQVLSEKGIEHFYLSADANEMNPTPDATLEYLRKLRKESPLAFNSLLYLEQPTERDLNKHMFSMREVSKIKPVLADEGVTDLKSFELALQLGWSGVAVKTCKWHSSSLIYIAKMERYKIPYSIQDLTCPGIALVHSASLAARTNPILGFEYNARQYLPFAYPKVQRRHETLFKVRDGKVRTDTLTDTGLGFAIRDIKDVLE